VSTTDLSSHKAPEDSPEVSLKDREDTLNRLRESGLTSDSVPLFLLDQYQQLAERQTTSLSVLDAKATAQIGFAGTAVALFTALGTQSTAPKLWISLAFFGLLLSIAFCACELWVKARKIPSLECYLLNKTLDDPKNKGRIAAELCGSWGDYASDVQDIAGKKANWLKAATLAFLFGILSLAVAYILK
jgi:hypothetical protein